MWCNLSQIFHTEQFYWNMKCDKADQGFNHTLDRPFLLHSVRGYQINPDFWSKILFRMNRSRNTDILAVRYGVQKHIISAYVREQANTDSSQNSDLPEFMLATKGSNRTRLLIRDPVRSVLCWILHTSHTRTTEIRTFPWFFWWWDVRYWKSMQGVGCVETHAGAEATPISCVDSSNIQTFLASTSCMHFHGIYQCAARVGTALSVLMNAQHACFSISNGYMIAKPPLRTCQDHWIWRPLYLFGK